MTPADPFFSIIIPTYNRGQLLIETMESILSEDKVAIEVVIVDDGSTDHTEHHVKRFTDNRVKFIKTSNVERGAARNIGLRQATGLFVNYFDSDDLYYPCLSAVLDFITANDFPPVVYGHIDSLAPDGTVSRDHALPFSSFKENILFNNFLACGSVFIKREVAMQYLFSDNRTLSGSEDWELWLRLYTGFDFVNVPISIFKQRQHSNRSLFTTDAANVTARENLFAKIINENRKILLKRFSEGEIDLLMADRMTFIALVQFMAGNRRNAALYLYRSLGQSIRVLSRKRFLAVAKKLILN